MTIADELKAMGNRLNEIAQSLQPEPIPEPPPSTDRYANLVGFGSVSFKKNTKTLTRLTNPNHVLNALETAGSAFELGADIKLPRRAMVASGIYANGNGFRLNSAASTVLELGEYGRPATAVSDVALVGMKIGPVPSVGPQTGDGIRVHAGSTRIWGDHLEFVGPYGDEAFSILHYVSEPKSKMWVSLTNSSWKNMMKSLGGSEYGVLVGTGGINYEIGKTPEGIEWAKTARREPPIALTLYRCEFENVWWRCPLVYSTWIHMKESKVKSWNHPDGGGPACDLYGAAEGLVEGCTFDKGTSSTKAAAIQCNSMEGYMPRLTERGNTFLGSYPWGSVVRNGASQASLSLPYSL